MVSIVLYAIKITDQNGKEKFFKETYKEWNFKSKDGNDLYERKIMTCEKIEDAFITSDNNIVRNSVEHLRKSYDVNLKVCKYIVCEVKQ